MYAFQPIYMSLLAATGYALWIVPAILEACLVSVILRRKLRSEFSAFFSYSVFQVLVFFCLFFTYFRAPQFYFSTYWTAGALDAAIGFQVIYEIFVNAFAPYPALRQLGKTLFRWAALVLLMVAFIAAVASPSPLRSGLMAGIFILERSVLLMQCGLVLLLFTFSGSLGIDWRNRIFGVALGFGLYAAAQLIVFTMRSQLGPQLGSVGRAALILCNGGAYTLAVLIWLRYMLSPQPVRSTAFQPEPDRWNLALAGAGGHPHNEQESSILPSIENTVERVLMRGRQKASFQIQ